MVCHCLAVRESEVLAAIRGGAVSVESVGGLCEAGTGCSSCHDSIRELLREQAKRDLASSRAPKSLRQLSLFDAVDDGQRRKQAPAGSHKRAENS
ncbi:(2Fe-2S)-binding protein [Pseudenhygromyxa sp. WMMC2535]|nr:(2Fe-2S)-binding protein [Pseudenhygromyxa sp. WMMC2535]NVB42040.1 (2Fe-2S)-binding protein [Pseudenhygromyxa sp. WMMC2535]